MLENRLMLVASSIRGYRCPGSDFAPFARAQGYEQWDGLTQEAVVSIPAHTPIL